MAPPKKDYFKEFIDQNNLIENAKVSDVRTVGDSRRVAVDAAVILNEIREAAKTSEPLWALTGSIPQIAEKITCDWAAKMKQLGIEPVVIFNGMKVMQLAPHEPPYQAQPFDGWNSLMNGQTSLRTMDGSLREKAEKSFKDVPFDDEVESAVAQFLRRQGVEVWHAPFWAWGQMAAFMAESNKYVAEVYGPRELIMYRGVDRVILSFDEADQSMKFIDKSNVLTKIQAISAPNDLSGCTADDLTHAIILDSSHPQLHEEILEYQVCHSFPHLLGTMLARDSSSSSGKNPIAAKVAGMESTFKFPFFRARAAVECPLVMHHSGQCVPLSRLFKDTTTYTALRDIFGFPVPALYYYFVSVGLLNPAVLSTVVSQRIIDHAPVAETREFHQAAECIIPLRTQIMYQLIQVLAQDSSNANFSQNQYSLVWYRTYIVPHARGQGNPIPILRPPPIKLDEWVSLRPTPTTPSFHSVLKYADKAQATGVYANANEAAVAAHLKALDLLGYFTHATHQNTQEVSGPSIYSDALSQCDADQSDFGVLLIELVRTKNLTDAPLHFAASKVEDRTSVSTGENLAIRMMSMLPLKLKEPWSGPVHPGLLAYNAMMRTLHRTLRSLMEVISVTLFFGEPECGNNFTVDQYHGLAEMLPFRSTPGVQAGIVFNHIMNDDQLGKADSPSAAFDQLKQSFPECADLEGDVKFMQRFWKSARNIIATMCEDEQHQNQSHNSDLESISKKVDARFALLGL